MWNRWLLVSLTSTGCALCWLSISVERSLDLPPRIPIVCAMLCTAVATTISRNDWLLLSIAAGISAFFGLVLSYTIWWPSDSIAGPWVPYSVIGDNAVTVVLSIITGLVVRTLSTTRSEYRNSAWVTCCASWRSAQSPSR